MAPGLLDLSDRSSCTGRLVAPVLWISGKLLREVDEFSSPRYVAMVLAMRSVLISGGCRGVGALLFSILWASEQDRLWDWPRDFVCGLAV